MVDPPLPPPSVAQLPERRQIGGFTALTALSGLVAVILWIATAVKAQQNHTDLEEISNSFVVDASAVQISQVADQSLIQILPLVAASLAATTAMLFFVALGVLTRSGG